MDARGGAGGGEVSGQTLTVKVTDRGNEYTVTVRRDSDDWVLEDYSPCASHYGFEGGFGFERTLLYAALEKLEVAK